MRSEILNSINELFDSYDLFGGSGIEEALETVSGKFPDITEEELKEFGEYLEGFYDHCLEYGDILAEKYKSPFLPTSKEAKKEIAEYVAACREKYPEIDEKHIIELFSTDCWLTNR